MSLRLFHSAASPYVRKVLVCAHEKGVADQIETLPAQAQPVNRDANIVRENPSGKVPTALLADGAPLFDSRVICAYVDTMSPTPPLYPASGKARFAVLTLEALADSMLDAAILARYETALRPEDLRWDQWLDGQIAKIDSGLDDLQARWMDLLRGDINAGAIAVGCTLGYLDFRFGDKDWRKDHGDLADWYAGFAARASMQATQPA